MTGRNLARAATIAVAIVGTGAGLFLGCGGGGGGKPLTEADFCSQKAEAECVVTSKCLTDMTACKNQRVAMCTAFAAAAKASTKRVFVPGNVGDCISKTKNAYGKPTITPGDMAMMDEACNYVFQGKGEVNVDSCDVKYDCAKKVICDKSLCATQKSVTGACANPGDTCPSDQYCAQNASSVYVCMPKGSNGATCDGSTPCVDNLRCSGTSCADRVAQAGACTSNADCVSTAPYCDPYAGNKCDQGLSFASGSTSCNDYGGSGTPAGTGGAGGIDGGPVDASTGSGGGGGGGTGGAGGGTGGSSGGLGGLGGLGGIGGGGGVLATG